MIRGSQDGSVAKRLERNLKAPGSSPSSGTLRFSVLVRPQCPDWVIKRGVCKSVYGCVDLKEHLGLFEKNRGLSPIPGFYLSSSHRYHFIAANWLFIRRLTTSNQLVIVSDINI